MIAFVDHRGALRLVEPVVAHLHRDVEAVRPPGEVRPRAQVLRAPAFVIADMDLLRSLNQKGVRDFAPVSEVSVQCESRAGLEGDDMVRVFGTAHEGRRQQAYQGDEFPTHDAPH